MNNYRWRSLIVRMNEASVLAVLKPQPKHKCHCVVLLGIEI